MAQQDLVGSMIAFIAVFLDGFPFPSLLSYLRW
jgi:hypothetical protein